jgi:hypothetical protein
MVAPSHRRRSVSAEVVRAPTANLPLLAWTKAFPAVQRCGVDRRCRHWFTAQASPSVAVGRRRLARPRGSSFDLGNRRLVRTAWLRVPAGVLSPITARPACSRRQVPGLAIKSHVTAVNPVGARLQPDESSPWRSVVPPVRLVPPGRRRARDRGGSGDGVPIAPAVRSGDRSVSGLPLAWSTSARVVVAGTPSSNPRQLLRPERTDGRPLADAFIELASVI